MGKEFVLEGAGWVGMVSTCVLGIHIYIEVIS